MPQRFMWEKNSEKFPCRVTRHSSDTLRRSCLHSFADYHLPTKGRISVGFYQLQKVFV